MRIISLLPSATEMVYLLGLGDQLVATSHECDFPPEVVRKPRATRSVLHNGMDSGEIDRLVRERRQAGLPLYELDFDVWHQAAPDLVITQKLCDVCAVSFDNVARAVALLEPPPKILTLEPQSLEDIFANLRAVGAATGAGVRAEAVVGALAARVRHVRDRAPGTTLKVLCLEWLDPPFCAGHWLPQLVSYAGGVDGLGRPAADSVRVEWETIRQYDPAVIVVMCCGFGIPRTLEDLAKLRNHEVWRNLRAVRNGSVFVADGNHHFSRPGPRLVDSLEIMAGILHPAVFPQFAGKQFVRCA
ncbi:cobalamin-binding protein [Verrucomicrobiota bacterium]|nr:cobalamin-binding protein [Verrucomicrobiota bacterium]